MSAVPRHQILDRLSAGKLPAKDLDRLIAALPATDPRVLLGPHLGEDAAVIEMGDRCLVATTDPVTFATDRIGWYAVHVNANDVAVMGAQPRWFLAVVLLPAVSSTRGLARAIMDDIGATCDELGVTVCGGHTETTPGIERPVVVGQMLGEVPPQRLVRKSRLAVGDDIILTRARPSRGPPSSRESSGRDSTAACRISFWNAPVSCCSTPGSASYRLPASPSAPVTSMPCMIRPRAA